MGSWMFKKFCLRISKLPDYCLIKGNGTLKNKHKHLINIIMDLWILQLMVLWKDRPVNSKRTNIEGKFLGCPYGFIVQFHYDCAARNHTSSQEA